jgi:hypothetical protein
MRAPTFERQCPEHRLRAIESDDIGQGGGHVEVLRCPLDGHKMSSWLIVRIEDGTIVGHAGWKGGLLMDGMSERRRLRGPNSAPLGPRSAQAEDRVEAADLERERQTA